MPRRAKPATQPQSITIHLGHQEPEHGLGDLWEILFRVCHRHDADLQEPPPPRPTPDQPRRRRRPPKR